MSESNRLTRTRIARGQGELEPEASMLTFNDCLSLSDLTEEEVVAISEHERCADIVAAEIGHALLQSEQGITKLKRFILDDIAHARALGYRRKTAWLEEVYRRFDATHPPHQPAA